MTKNRFSCRIRDSSLCRLQCRVLWLFRVLRLRRRVDYALFCRVRNSLEFWDSFKNHTVGVESLCGLWEIHPALVELAPFLIRRRE